MAYVKSMSIMALVPTITHIITPYHNRKTKTVIPSIDKARKTITITNGGSKEERQLPTPTSTPTPSA
jgi:hypothetical protein